MSHYKASFLPPPWKSLQKNLNLKNNKKQKNKPKNLIQDYMQHYHLISKKVFSFAKLEDDLVILSRDWRGYYSGPKALYQDLARDCFQWGAL